MVRVINYFDTQIRVPVNSPDKLSNVEAKGTGSAPTSTSAFQAHLREGVMGNKPMTNDQLISWYGKILEGVKQRYRKLQRLAR